MSRRYLVALLAAGALIAPAAADARVVVTGDDAARYQSSVDALKLPTPDVVVKVVVGPCPTGQTVRGCTDLTTIYLTPGIGETDRVFRHELGHAIDFGTFALDYNDRHTFQSLFPGAFDDASWWGDEKATHPPLEWWAESFYACGTDPTVAPTPDDGRGYAYGFDPNAGVGGYPALCAELARELAAAPAPTSSEPPTTSSSSTEPPASRRRVCRKVRVRTTKTYRRHHHGRRFRVVRRCHWRYTR